MYCNILKAIKGYIAWKMLCIKYRIKYPDVIFVLPREYEKINKYMLVHMNDYIMRKSADKIVILTDLSEEIDYMKEQKGSYEVVVCKTDKKYIQMLFEFYSFYKFYDNIVFSHTDKPNDNMLAYLLNSTEVNEEEAVCLGLFQLRNM